MQQWQYKRIVVHFGKKNTPNDWIKYAFSNARQVMEDVDAAYFFEYLNKQGKEGWEMVDGSSYSNDSSHVEVYFLKRSIELAQ
jgi:hypothetical protein